MTSLFLLLMPSFLFGQDNSSYSALIKEAWGFYEKGEYLKSGQTYTVAFKTLGDKGLVSDRYNAACGWALGSQKDLAFYELSKVANSGNYTDLDHLSSDIDLKSLHLDRRWNDIIELVKESKKKEETNIDKSLVAILDTIYDEDQKYRNQIEEIEKKYGRQSEEMKAHWNLISEIDSINLIKVCEILDECGWLGADVIGRQGNMTLFLVIQHSDLKIQEKYLPMMRDAASKGNANPANLALLEDRVALRQGKKQVYGSQIGRDNNTGEFCILPLDDPDNVDKRREKLGLGKLQNYVSRWEITWDIDEYKKKLPDIETKNNN